MATYKQIFGKQVKFLSADPPAALGEGQIWYNSTSNTFKAAVNVTAWASANASPVAKRSGGSAGTQTANVIFAGSTPTGSINVTGEYDGTNWTTSGVYGASSYALSGFGIQTAAIGMGGMIPPGGVPTPFEYDGSSWTATPGVNTSAASIAGAGTTAAGLKFGGSTIPFASVTNSSEEWNGSSWTASPGNLNTARAYLGGFGTQTAALGAGGYKPANATEAETYDGSTWTATTALPGSRMMGGCSGTQTAAFYFGGSLPGQTATGVVFDGSSWAASPASLASARNNLTGSPSGTSASALATCGTTPSAPVNNTEEFTDAVTVQTITTS